MTTAEPDGDATLLAKKTTTTTRDPETSVLPGGGTTFTFEEGVEFIGFGRFHVFLMIACGFGWFAEILELVIMAFVAPAIQNDMNLSSVEYGLLGSSSFIGMAIGAVFWGALSDRFGRFIGFTCTTAMTFVFSVASAFAPNYGVLLLFRILACVGVGGTLPVDYAHLVEFLPVRGRGRNMAIVDGIGVIPALFLGSLLAYFGTADGTTNWRLILGVESVPAGIFTVIRFFIPESPRYLLNLNKKEEAANVLRRVARMCGKEAPEGDLVGYATPLETRNPLARFREILSPEVRSTTWRIWLMAFCAQFASAGFVFAMPKLFESELGLPPKQVSLMILLGVVGVIPGLIIAFFAIEWSRKKSISVFYLASAVGVALFVVATMAAGSVEFAVAASMVARGGMEGMFSILNTIRVEVYPTTNRITAMGTSQVFYNLGGAITTLIFGAMSGSRTLAAVCLSIYAGAYALSVLPALTLPAKSDYAGRAVLDRITQLVPINV